MSNMEDAIERIKILECPTGDVEKRVAGIFEQYGVAKIENITVHREAELDQDHSEAFIADFNNQQTPSVVILARSGYDDYVAKVTDVYVE